MMLPCQFSETQILFISPHMNTEFEWDSNNEDIERKMNFIVEQQAQFASDIQQLQESQSRTEQVVAGTSKP